MSEPKKQPTNSHRRLTRGRSKTLRPGQPNPRTKLDDRLERELCRHIEEGLPLAVVADLTQISRSTLNDWLARGEAEPKGRYGLFARRIAQANAQAVRKLHNQVVRRGRAEWILSRRFQEYYPPPWTRDGMASEDGEGLPMSLPVRIIVERRASKEENDDDGRNGSALSPRPENPTGT
jgi:hypothetical protein